MLWNYEFIFYENLLSMKITPSYENFILRKFGAVWYNHAKCFLSVLCVHVLYCIAGFVCEVLICTNYARCHGLAHFNSTVTFNSAIVLGLSQLCALLYLIVQIFNESSFLHWTAKDLGNCDYSTALQSIFCNKTLP